MKRNKTLALGISFLSCLFFIKPVTLANETNTTSTKTNESSSNKETNNETPAYTDNDPLNQALLKAVDQGLIAVETETETFETEKDSRQNFAQQAESINAQIKLYQDAKLSYEKAEKEYQEYQKKIGIYQAELAQYVEYQKKLKQYNVELKTYNLAKVRYEEDYNTALYNNNKVGYLPEILAQNLIFRSEPNAIQTITGNIG